MDKSAKSDKSAKGVFVNLLKQAFSWLAASGKLGKPGESVRYEAEFSKLCGSDVKNTRRWLAGKNLPQRDSWKTAATGLTKAGVGAEALAALDDAWAAATNVVGYPPPADSTSKLPLPYSVTPRNSLPKLCMVNLEIPEQGSSRDDFIVVGEVRFSRAPDLVDDLPVTIGVRRAVLLPVSTSCRVRPGSLFRPSDAGAGADKGAAQIVFAVGEDTPVGVLQGDQLRGETLGRFVAAEGEDSNAPRVEALVQIESADDVDVSIKGEPQGASAAQIKLAEKWMADQFAKTVREPDGSLRLSSCLIRWGDE